MLIDKYRVNTDLIDYIGFSNRMEKMNCITKATINDIDSQLQQLLVAINNVIKTKRVLIKSPFQDYDRTKSSHISRNQFIRVLNQLELVPKNPALQDRLLDFYENKNDRQINYVRFCEDVDHIQNV